MQKRIIEVVEVQRSSGNDFADLGLPDAEKLKIKTGLVIRGPKQRSFAEVLAAMPNVGVDADFARTSGV